MKDLIEMHKSLNLKDYLDLKAKQSAEEAARQINENRY